MEQKKLCWMLGLVTPPEMAHSTYLISTDIVNLIFQSSLTRVLFHCEYLNHSSFIDICSFDTFPFGHTLKTLLRNTEGKVQKKTCCNYAQSQNTQLKDHTQLFSDTITEENSVVALVRVLHCCVEKHVLRKVWCCNNIPFQIKHDCSHVLCENCCWIMKITRGGLLVFPAVLSRCCHSSLLLRS